MNWQTVVDACKRVSSRVRVRLGWSTNRTPVAPKALAAAAVPQPDRVVGKFPAPGLVGKFPAPSPGRSQGLSPLQAQTHGSPHEARDAGRAEQNPSPPASANPNRTQARAGRTQQGRSDATLASADRARTNAEEARATPNRTQANARKR